MADSKKDELVRFLEERAFKPVLNAKPKGRSETEQKKLEHVQKATRAEIERFHNYGSAQEVVTNFKRDLGSEPAKRIHAAGAQETAVSGSPRHEGCHHRFDRRGHEPRARRAATGSGNCSFPVENGSARASRRRTF